MWLSGTAFLDSIPSAAKGKKEKKKELSAKTNIKHNDMIWTIWEVTLDQVVGGSHTLEMKLN